MASNSPVSQSRLVGWSGAKYGLCGLSLAAALLASYGFLVWCLGNVHVVDEGELYRSARLQRSQLEQVIHLYSIKSILNVRGPAVGEAWYDDEILVARNLQLAHFDYGISASHVVTMDQIKDILKILRDAPKPLLVHCDGGADRAGLVSALFLAEIEKKPADEAARQLSIIYGHFPYLLSKAGAMDQSFWAFVEANASAPPM
jgi:protein tyrosine/serine phosphatase